MTTRTFARALVLCSALFLVACAEQKDEPADSAADPATETPGGAVAESTPDPAPGSAPESAPESTPSLEGIQSNNELGEVTGRVLYESADGDFSVYLPPGCSSYRERFPVENEDAEAYEMVKMAVFVYCDRQDRRNEGCSVTAYIDDDLDAGAPADPDFVQQRVVSILQKYNARVVNQKPVNEVIEGGPRVEGIDVLATDEQERGQVWVRGLLVEGDVYILTAWRAEGALAHDPEIVQFFESFRAHM